MRLGVLGGTFDPIHNGHIAAARAAATALHLDRVLLVPAGRPWHRDDAPVASAQQRLRMTQLAVSDDPVLSACPFDVDRAGDTYAVDLLRDVRAAYPAADLFLIVGQDAFARLDTWRSPDAIKEMAQIAVVTRAASDRTDSGPDVALEAGHAEAGDDGGRERTPGTFESAGGQGIRYVPLTGFDISATHIRRRCAAREPIGDLVPQQVADFIASNGLYR